MTIATSVEGYPNTRPTPIPSNAPNAAEAHPAHSEAPVFGEPGEPLTPIEVAVAHADHQSANKVRSAYCPVYGSAASTPARRRTPGAPSGRSVRSRSVGMTEGSVVPRRLRRRGVARNSRSAVVCERSNRLATGARRECSQSR